MPRASKKVIKEISVDSSSEEEEVAVEAPVSIKKKAPVSIKK